MHELVLSLASLHDAGSRFPLQLLHPASAAAQLASQLRRRCKLPTFRSLPFLVMRLAFLVALLLGLFVCGVVAQMAAVGHPQEQMGQQIGQQQQGQ